MTKESVRGKRVLEGIVVSDKMDKTVTVRVHRKQMHSLYKKTVIRDKKFKAHDPLNKAKAGDRVRIVESRHFSKDKYFQLLGIVRAAGEGKK